MTNLLFDRNASLETITLDRPEVLNALNGEMVRALSDKLADIQKDQQIQAVFIKGAGGKAFCAGGDIKAARLGAMAIKEGRIELAQVVQFFVEEYGLNKALYHSETPTISFMNGITMGGGVGIAGACKYRVATEKTVWAMPEVTIGFFPDVGAAHYLSRAPKHVGRYLGLTGGHLSNAADLIKCGFATHLIPLKFETQLVEMLANDTNIDTVLDSLSAETGECELPYDSIETCFAADTVEEILRNLEEENSEWSIATKALIETKSPTSLKVALRHIDQAGQEDFDTVIARDLKLAGKFLSGDDLIEGVRAVVVDKDKSPKWNPATLGEVSLDQVNNYIN